MKIAYNIACVYIYNKYIYVCVCAFITYNIIIKIAFSNGEKGTIDPFHSVSLSRLLVPLGFSLKSTQDLLRLLVRCVQPGGVAVLELGKKMNK
jgi:hypothetical protein